MREAPALGIRRALGRAVGRVTWAFVDQALTSFANFGANLVLAVWLAPVDYGGYMAATAVFWISLGVQGGLVIQPMTVFGAGRFHDRASEYLTVLTCIDFAISMTIAAALAIGGLSLIFWDSQITGLSMLGYAVATPLLLLTVLLRRTFYVWSHPRLAAGANAIYVAGLFTILYVLHSSATLSSFTTPLAAAGASILTIASMIWMRRLQLWSRPKGGFLREVVATHWQYGRWAVATEVVAWVPGQLYYLIVPVLIGLEANAALNVLWNLVMPAVQAISATGLLLVPAFTRAQQDRRAAPLMWGVAFLLVSGAAVYVLLIGLFGGALIELIYRGRYMQYAHLDWLMALSVLPIAAFITFGSALRARERPDCELSAYVAATLVTCIGIAAIVAWGLLGAVLGQLAGQVTTMFVMLWWVFRTDNDQSPKHAPAA